MNNVYDKLYRLANWFLLIYEYYNLSPVKVTYRGHSDQLFKQDFAQKLLEKYSDLQLVGYVFSYNRDVASPQDDITWFLIERSSKHA